MDPKLSELLELHRQFAERTTTVRGRKVQDRAIFVSLDFEGCGEITAYLEPHGSTAEQRVDSVLHPEQPHYVDAQFLDVRHLLSILRGEVAADWHYDDENNQE